MLSRSYVGLKVGPARHRERVSVTASVFDVSIRPYTTRKGDTLDSIAKKRGLSVKDILGMNPDVNPDRPVDEGRTILVPAGTLSSRDREILGGIGTGYRVYPVRAVETIKDVITKRGISRDEMLALNPGTNLDALQPNQMLKLPANKFTVREREMLIGSGILPAEFFTAAKNPFVIGLSVLMLVCGFVLAWQQFYKDEDEEPPKEV